MSKPCVYCANYLKFMSIKKIHYSIDAKTMICEKVVDLQTKHLSSIRKMIKKPFIN